MEKAIEREREREREGSGLCWLPNVPLCMHLMQINGWSNRGVADADLKVVARACFVPELIFFQRI